MSYKLYSLVISMVYLGRICGVGKTRDGKTALIYAVSGRSEPSKQRKATVHNNTVHIGGLDDSDADPLRHYDAMMLGGNNGVATNGDHTKEVFKVRSEEPRSKLERVLEKRGPEEDSYCTPRIAAYIQHITIGSTAFAMAYLARVSRSGVDSIPIDLNFSNGFTGISTYAGDREDSRNVIIPETSTLVELPISGFNARELARELYEWMDHEFIVCTAAAVSGQYPKQTHRISWNWDIAIKNKHD